VSRSKAPFIWLCGACLLLSACGGSDGPETVLVEGTVTFNGAPLETGSIRFVDAAGEDKDYAGKIENGAFSFPSTVGHKEVAIVSEKQVDNPTSGVPGTIGDPPSAENRIVVVNSVIPTKYNDVKTSQLIANVTSAGPNTFTFDLQPTQ
jgi:hypothetical protein